MYNPIQKYTNCTHYRVSIHVYMYNSKQKNTCIIPYENTCVIPMVHFTLTTDYQYACTILYKYTCRSDMAGMTLILEEH